MVGRALRRGSAQSGAASSLRAGFPNSTWTQRKVLTAIQHKHPESHENELAVEMTPRCS